MGKQTAGTVVRKTEKTNVNSMIKPGEPFEVTEKQYNDIRYSMGGYVFSRIDENGKHFIKAYGGKPVIKALNDYMGGAK